MIAARTIWIGLACVVVGVGADALFLPHQTIWNDEWTQLQGLTLNLVEVTRWLADRVQYEFGVADDRMPPLSYWIGWVWSRVFGLREVPMRWLGVVGVAAGTAVVFAAAHRAWGLGAGVAAALLLATSPNVVTFAVEIRAYPLLILASAGVFACLLGYADGSPESRWRWLAGMVACGAAAMYTHFFGLVALGGALVAALLLSVRRGEGVVPPVAAGFVAGLVAVGLVPFVRASVGLSAVPASPSTRQKVVGLLKLVYRQFSHPATSVSRVAVIAAALAFALGLLCALTRKRRAGSAALGLGVALAAGVAVVALAHLAQSSFDAAQPNYNCWMLPGLALLVASGLAAEARPIRIGALVAVVLGLTANTYGVAQLAIHGEAFAHTAYRPVGELIQRMGPGRVVVIHDDQPTPAESWATHVPIAYNFAGAVREYATTADPQAGQVTLTDFPARHSTMALAEVAADDLIVVRTRVLAAADIAAQLRTGVVPIADGPATTALLQAGDWQRVEESTHIAFWGVGIDVFRRVPRP